MKISHKLSKLSKNCMFPLFCAKLFKLSQASEEDYKHYKWGLINVPIFWPNCRGKHRSVLDKTA